MMSESSDPVYSTGRHTYESWSPYGGTSESVPLTYLSSYNNRYWSTQSRPYVNTLPYTVERGYYPVQSGWVQSTDPSAEGGARLISPLALDSWAFQSYQNPSGFDVVDRLTKAQNDAILKAGESRFSTIEFAAEFGKTVDFVRDLAILALNWKRTLSRLLRDQRNSLRVRRQIGASFNKDVSGVLDTLFDGWMVWRYCILTSMMDAEDMAAAAADQLYGHIGVERIRKRPQAGSVFTRSWANQPNVGVITCFGATNIQQLVNVRADYSYVIRVWIVLSNDTSGAGGILHRWGLNPIEAAWNLVPMSFVADWALGIGDYLAGQTALLSKTIIDAGWGVESRLTLTVTAPGMTGPTWESPIRVTGRSSHYQRQPWQPVYEYRIAHGLSEALNWKRLLDSAAILRKL